MSDPQTANTHRTLGQTLKGLREARNLTLSDIASRLHLDPRVIAAIESGDHEALPAALYVRGYLRGYARILGADPENLVRMYNEEAPSAPPDIVPEFRHPAQPSSEDAPVRAVSFAVVLLLGVLLAIWWRTTYQPGTRPLSEPGATPAATAAKPEAPKSQLSYSYTVVTHPTSAYFRAPDLAITADAGAVAPTGPDQVVFRATSDSWLEVTDRSGERIYMDFVRGGESLTLNGHAPFNVILGYAPGVTVEFNGQPYDPSPFTRAGVARFSLGR